MHLLSLSTRSWLIVGSAVLVACGALGVACSSGPPYNADGGLDSGGTDVKTDRPIPPDGSKLDGGGRDGDGGSVGPCATTEITGECDIVAQTCGIGKECVIAQGSDGGFVTACALNGGGTIPEGYACTPNANNPCVPGLECDFNRCAKHCCFGNDSECGTSPEGYIGRCNLNITGSDNSPLYSVCTYSPGCQPFDIQPCSSTQACLVQDNAGTATCTDYSGPDGGLPEKATCAASNACLDGMYCLTKGDAGSSCMWACYFPPGPYDAGVANLGPGKGGCPATETCRSVNWGGALPTWLGVCE